MRKLASEASVAQGATGGVAAALLGRNRVPAAPANRPARLEVTFVELKDYNESTSLGKKNLPSL